MRDDACCLWLTSLILITCQGSYLQGLGCHGSGKESPADRRWSNSPGARPTPVTFRLYEFFFRLFGLKFGRRLAHATSEDSELDESSEIR